MNDIPNFIEENDAEKDESVKEAVLLQYVGNCVVLDPVFLLSGKPTAAKPQAKLSLAQLTKVHSTY